MSEVIFGLIREIIALSPGLRFMQVIYNAVPFDVAQRYGNDFYYIEDVQMVAYLYDYEAKIRQSKENQ